ncbi:MAG TPA: LuxR C-terminal-related transcriptional regulator, partial [Actinomycetota bacterium]|nr:LuxR C-terminal-related transcriptional regulator [Actinomycetota bacterium]
AHRGDTWRPGFAALLAELGMDHEVRRELEQIRRSGLDVFRRSLWLATLSYLSDACSAVGDVEVAGLVYPELAPLSGANVMIGHGVGCYGAADRYLGMLAAVLGDLEAAERHFEAAIDLNRAMGGSTWLAHTAYEYGRMLLAGGDRTRAAPLVAEAVAIAESVGMPTLLARARALGVGGTPTVTAPDDLSGREVDVLRLVARGLSNREIGVALHISEHTAANHVRSILRKTDSANRTEATAYAYRRGLARP